MRDPSDRIDDSETYRFGFLFAADQPRLVPAGFRKIDPLLHLYADPSSAAAARGDTGLVVLIGNAIDPEYPGRSHQEIVNALSGGEDFRATIDRLVGRFAVIWQRPGEPPRLVTDPIGMRAVFHAHIEGVSYAGSHAGLVARQAQAPDMTLGRGRPWRLGFFGLHTPYCGVFVHAPSTERDLITGSARRIFPDTETRPMSPGEAAASIIAQSDPIARELAMRGNTVVSLTAGRDSRATLAMLLPYQEAFEFFTYTGDAASTQIDMRVAPDIARGLGLRHTLVTYGDEPAPPGLLESLRANSYSKHSYKLALAYRAHFGAHRRFHVRSNAIEFFRTSAVDKLKIIPSTPEEAARLYLSCGFPPEAQRNMAFAVQCFAHQFETTGWKKAMAYSDPRDLYFIDHRMGHWHAGVVLESDIAFDTSILFNSRLILNTVHAVPKHRRLQGELIRALYQQRAPEVLRWPFNPRSYP